MNFQNPRQLEVWLHSHSINTSQWGRGSAKTVENLWQELASGDSSLQPDPVLRKVRVASALIYQEDRQLIEAVQTFYDGRKRYPDRAPSEKMQPHENPEAAALRCLREEVGYTSDAILLPPQLIGTEIINRDSPSYPTLPTEFTFHTLKLTVRGLPTTDFVTFNQADNDPVHSIGWTWKEVE